MSNLEQRLERLESAVQRMERKIDRLLEAFGLEPSEDQAMNTEPDQPIALPALADIAADYPEVQAEPVPVKQGMSEESAVLLKICEEMERERLKPKIETLKVNWSEESAAATKLLMELYGPKKA